ncbi:MAG TPA: hypothetical protein VM939_01110 [Gemmatimonadaceae bacterium]|nr:hypothetical protein [Gemmatimonadaceae bacterium]
MRNSFLFVSALVVGTGCVNETSAPGPIPTYRLTATVTEANNCAVEAQGIRYSSIGQIRGDVPTKFIGTVKDLSYHGFGCWVSVAPNSTAQGDGDLVIIFSGNRFNKPLAVGTYKLSREILDDMPEMYANVSFRPSNLGGDKLVTNNDASGSVVVDSTASGARRIRADVDVIRWTRRAF